MERKAEIPQVKNILNEELELFEDYLKSLDMLPLIADMRQNAEAIRQTELEKTLRHLPDLTEAERCHIDAMTQALVKKLLHAPTHRLRAEATSPCASEYAEIARKLFNLSDERTPSTPLRGLTMKLIFATRPSKLARWQTQWVINALQTLHPGLECEEKIITTQGDKILDRPLPEIGGKGLFTQELKKNC